MKKEISIIYVMLLIFVSLFLCCSCNRQVIDLKYKFNKAIIKVDCNKSIEIKVKKWNDYKDSDMVQVIDTNGVVYYTHGSNVILINE